MKEQIFAFIDLDNSFFQKKEKTPDIKNSIVGAWDKEEQPFSYMSKQQEHFYNLLKNNNNVKIIPTTARNLEQYSRTKMYKMDNLNTSILQLGSEIIINNKKDLIYSDIINEKRKTLPFSIKDLHLIFNHYFQNKLNTNFLYIKNLNENLLHFRIIDNNNYKIYNDEMYNEIKELLREYKIEEFYNIHLNDRYIDISGKFIDKSEAVKYFIDKFNPELKIGIGDAYSDNKFLNLMDFKILPTNSQLNNILNNLF